MFPVILAALPPPSVLGLRAGLIAVSLGIWFGTQALLGRRAPAQPEDGGVLGDGLHRWTAPWHRHLQAHPRAADGLLLVSSLVIDLLGIYILATAVFGASFGPFVGLFSLFILRQICQALCPLPPPPGMIWRNPGFPTLLVTYGTANDLFFSGHTAIAVYGSLCLWASFGVIGLAVGLGLTLFEMAVVIGLRAHYTADVFAGAVTALYVHHLAAQWAPWVDKWLS